MEFEISGRNVNISDRTREYAQEKMERFDKFASRIQRATLTLFKDADDKVAEILIRVRRDKDVVAEAKGETFFEALDLAADKAERQLKRRKDRVKDHRDHRAPQPPEPDLGSEEEPEDMEDADQEEIEG